MFKRACSGRRHVRANAATRPYEPVYPLATRAAWNCFAVRRCLRDSRWLARNQSVNSSAYGSSLLGLLRLG